MRDLGTIVEISALTMLDAWEELALRNGIALELIRHDHPWNILQALQQLAEEALGRGLAAPALDQPASADFNGPRVIIYLS